MLGVYEYRPAHPYRIRQVISEWGKDGVINVGQRASLYRVIERLLAADLIQVRETQRDAVRRTDGQRGAPTPAGRRPPVAAGDTAHPRQEFPISRGAVQPAAASAE